VPEGALDAVQPVLLVSEESYATYNPIPPEVVGASVFPEHVVAPLRQVVGVRRGGRFVMGRVSAIDLARRSITCVSVRVA
jgi:NADH dehydrogenase